MLRAGILDFINNNFRIGTLFILSACLLTVFLTRQAADEIDTVDIYPTAIKNLPTAMNYNSEEGFTCTGLTWDTKEGVFWIANFGKARPELEEIQPSLIKISEDFSCIYAELSLVGIADETNSMNLQGISYDGTDDSLWIVLGG